MVRSWPFAGRAVVRGSGRTSVTGAGSRARAMSLALDCRISVTARVSPGAVARSAVFSVAVVG
jgi:hypothetical protein